MHDVAWGGRERAHGGHVPRVPRGGYAPVYFTITFLEQSVLCFCWYVYHLRSYTKHTTDTNCITSKKVKIWRWANSINLHVFDFMILFKSRKFYAREMYMFYCSSSSCLNV